MKNRYIENGDKRDFAKFLINLLKLNYGIRFNGDPVIKVIWKPEDPDYVGLDIVPTTQNTKSNYDCSEGMFINNSLCIFRLFTSTLKFSDLIFCKPHTYSELKDELDEVYCNELLNKEMNSCWFIRRTQDDVSSWLVQDSSVHYFDEWSHAATTFFSEVRALKRIAELREEDRSAIFELVKYDKNSIKEV